jgi:aminopeptidase YwaD
MYPNTVMAMRRVMGVTVAIALAVAAAVPTGAAESDDAYDVAVAIARDGPRPAASRGERRAQIQLRERFRRAGLKDEVQRFRVRGRGRSRNVIGEYDSPSTCLRIVMAHADSGTRGPGANDNASGLGVLAALAPRLADLKPSCDVWLVATGAEERFYTRTKDHVGALALARLVKRRRLDARLRYALSLDEVGRGDSFWLRSPAGGPRRRVERELLAAARGAGVGVRWVRDSGGGNSDHREFELLGMRGAKLGVGAIDEPCRELPCDRAGRLRRASLENARRVVEHALRER